MGGGFSPLRAEDGDAQGEEDGDEGALPLPRWTAAPLPLTLTLTFLP